MSDRIDLWAGVVIVGLFLIYLVVFAIVARRSIWEAVRGPDGKLQMPELIVAVVLQLFVMVVILDAGFDKHTSEAITWSIDTVLVFALGGKIANDRINKRDG